MTLTGRAITVGAFAVASARLTGSSGPAAQGTRPIPPANVQFRDEAGQPRKGVRCAAPFVNPAQVREARALADAGASDQAPIAGTATATIQIPVAFHVVHTKRRGLPEGDVPDSQIDDQIQVLNDALEPLGFSFYLASVDRTNNSSWYTGCYNASTESSMKEALAVDPATTLNIYTCNPTQGILGYAYYPWSIPEDSFLHGVVALYSSLPGGTAVPYDEGDTVTHEVGHYLGLRHTFDSGCASPGDEVDDTPAEASAAFDCPIGRDTCAAPGLDPIHNFMDYTDDACMFEFTDGQGARMVTAVDIYKPGLSTPAPAVATVRAIRTRSVRAHRLRSARNGGLACSDGVDDDCDGPVGAPIRLCRLPGLSGLLGRRRTLFSEQPVLLGQVQGENGAAELSVGSEISLSRRGFASKVFSACSCSCP
jgi:hypothetical protein